MNKEAVYQMLPPEVRKMTWSCRTPIWENGRPPKECGKCKPCKDLNKIRENDNG